MTQSKKSRGLVSVWKRTGVWIDQNWMNLERLCMREANDTGEERPFVEAEISLVEATRVIFKIKSNSQYVFQYMMRESILTSAVKTNQKYKG